MNILSIQAHHHSSVAFFQNSKLIYFHQEERLSKVKYEGSIPIKCLEEVRKITKKIDNLVITGYDFYDEEMSTYLKILDYFGFEVDKCELYNKSHHLSHAIRSFFASGFSESIVVVWDGRGSKYNLSDGSDAYETTSVFEMSYTKKPKLLYKKLYRENSTNNTKDLKIISPKVFEEYSEDFEIEILNNNHDIGHYYSTMNMYFGFNFLECGKLMGLHPYGSENKTLSKLMYDNDKFTNNLIDKGNKWIIDEEKLNLINLENKIDIAYETQKGLEKIGLNFIKKILDKTNSKNVVLSGGVSLNIVANSFYRKNLDKGINLYVDPLCDDCGNSIGIGQLFFLDKYCFLPIIEEKIYLCGNFPSYDFELKIGEKVFDDVDYSFIVDLLLNENIVAIFQGKSEAGPRALGNRSILFDPRIRDGKNIVNRIKKRESFRPFACSILLEESHKWFDMSDIKESPYMMYSFEALPGVKNIIPSVVHVDNTCRIQTVTQEQNFHYYNLIKEFYLKTNVPILFNTSFNLAGEVMVENIDDALSTLRRSELEYLYLPDIKKLVYIKNN